MAEAALFPDPGKASPENGGHAAAAAVLSSGQGQPRGGGPSHVRSLSSCLPQSERASEGESVSLYASGQSSEE